MPNPITITRREAKIKALSLLADILRDGDLIFIFGEDVYSDALDAPDFKPRIATLQNGINDAFKAVMQLVHQS